MNIQITNRKIENTSEIGTSWQLKDEINTPLKLPNSTYNNRQPSRRAKMNAQITNNYRENVVDIGTRFQDQGVIKR